MTGLPRRPLAGLALCFVSGIAIGQGTSVPVPVVLAGTVLCLLLAVITQLPKRPCFAVAADLLILASTLGVGWSHTVLSRPRHPPLEIVKAGADMDLIGTIAEEPVPVLSTNKYSLWSFPLEVDQLRERAAVTWSKQSGSVRVRLSASTGARLPAYGERWSFSGRLNRSVFKQGRKAGQPAGFHLFASGHHAHFLSSGHGNPLVGRCLAARSWAGSLLSRGIEDFPEQVTILNSLLLGYYSQIPKDLYQAFAATGTLHVFAISGSHVVIVCTVIIVALAACGIPRTRWILFLGPLLAGYTIMTGFQVSAVRACIMAILFWTAPFLGRKADIYAALAASGILIVGVNPEDLFQIGFVLSFVAVLGLVLFYPVFVAPLRRCFQADPLQLQPDPLWKRYLRKGWHFIADLLAMSLAAWLVSAPLTAWYFETFSPIGLLGNLLAVPVASLIIITGFLSLTLGACVGYLADLFNHANLVLIYLLTTTIRLFASVPYGYVRVGAPPAWLLLAFYGLLAFWRFKLWVDSPRLEETGTSPNDGL